MALIKLKVKGGFGNQLSQISFAYKLLKMYSKSKLFIDKKLCSRANKRYINIGNLVSKTNNDYFYLDDLPVSDIFTTKYNFSLFQTFVLSIHEIILFILKLIDIGSRLVGLNFYFNSNFYKMLSRIGIYTDSNRFFIDFNSSFIPVITISGYFQDIKYHIDQKEALKKFFLIKPPFIDNKLSNKLNPDIESASFLIRLGKDKVLNFNTEIFLEESYKIISKIKKNYNFLFFSDKEDLLNKLEIKFSEPKFFAESDPKVQLYLASLSNLFVLDSSSFAWWAYFLSDNNRKIVIKYSKWFRDNDQYNPGFFKGDKIYSIDV